MESFILFVLDNATHAHLILFTLLMLAGLNIPFSEDFILIVGGMLGSTLLFQETTTLYIWLFLGCYLSSWEAYWLGRIFGEKLAHYRLFKKTLHPNRLKKIYNFYEKHAFLTLLIGRFIPFGVRNCLFMAAGIAKFPFFRFILRDLIPCLFSSLSIFSLGYTFGKNYQVLYEKLHHYQLILFLSSGVLAIGFILFQYRKKSKKCYNPKQSTNDLKIKP